MTDAYANFFGLVQLKDVPVGTIFSFGNNTQSIILRKVSNHEVRNLRKDKSNCLNIKNGHYCTVNSNVWCRVRRKYDK